MEINDAIHEWCKEENKKWLRSKKGLSTYIFAFVFILINLFPSMHIGWIWLFGFIAFFSRVFFVFTAQHYLNRYQRSNTIVPDSLLLILATKLSIPEAAKQEIARILKTRGSVNFGDLDMIDSDLWKSKTDQERSKGAGFRKMISNASADTEIP